jgi:hypothetical protein
MNDVTPQSSGVSAQSNQLTEYRKSQIQQCFAAVHRSVSTQGSQSQQYLAAVQWWVAKLRKCSATVQWLVSLIQPGNCIQESQIRQCSPQLNGVSAHKEVSLDSILPQISGGLQDQARN